MISSTHHFLIRKKSSIELITSQSVFNYITSGHSIETGSKDDLLTCRIPFVSRTMSIRKAFKHMTERVDLFLFPCALLLEYPPIAY